MKKPKKSLLEYIRNFKVRGVSKDLIAWYVEYQPSTPTVKPARAKV